MVAFRGDSMSIRIYRVRVAAGLIVASKPAFGYLDWTPYYPIADYTVAIDNAIEFKKRFPQWRYFDSPVPREGCANPNLITLDELKAIRDGLLAEE